MERPTPGPQHAALARFEGTWNATETMAPSPWGPGGEATATITSRYAVDGMALVQDYAQTVDGTVVFRGHGVMQPDPQTGEVLWWWFDSMGFPPEPAARGRWDGATLAFEKSTPRGEARYTFRFDGPRYHFRIENRFPGQAEFVEFLRGEYVRI